MMAGENFSMPSQDAGKLKSLHETIMRQNESNAKLLAENRKLQQQIFELTGQSDAEYLKASGQITIFVLIA